MDFDVDCPDLDEQIKEAKTLEPDEQLKAMEQIIAQDVKDYELDHLIIRFLEAAKLFFRLQGAIDRGDSDEKKDRLEKRLTDELQNIKNLLV